MDEFQKDFFFEYLLDSFYLEIEGVGKFWIGLREPDFSRNDLIQMWPISKGEYSI